MIGHYGWTVVRALMDVYPDVGLQEHMFSLKTSMFKNLFSISLLLLLYSLFLLCLFYLVLFYLILIILIEKYWHNVDNHRDFFDRFAVQHKFDPLIPKNWYQINRETILKKVYKGGEKKKRERKNFKKMILIVCREEAGCLLCTTTHSTLLLHMRTLILAYHIMLLKVIPSLPPLSLPSPSPLPPLSLPSPSSPTPPHPSTYTSLQIGTNSQVTRICKLVKCTSTEIFCF